MSQVLDCNASRNTLDDELIKTQKNGVVGGWSFLTSLGNNNGTDPDRVGIERTDKFYVHPLVKRSSSKLNQRSLEMCTESLGSETGSHNRDDISLLVTEVTATSVVSASLKRREDGFWRKKWNSNRGEGFPPPINSICGGNRCDGGLKVKSYRQNGKLILRAVRVFSPLSGFRSERTEGRLRLCFLNETAVGSEGLTIENPAVNTEGLLSSSRCSTEDAAITLFNRFSVLESLSC